MKLMKDMTEPELGEHLTHQLRIERRESVKRN